MIKYIFWDFNGTILDDRKLCINLLNKLLEKEGKRKVTDNRYFEIFGFPIKDYYKKAGITFEKQSYNEMADWFIKNYQPKSFKQNLYEGVEETLIKLKDAGFINICLSASLEENLKEQLRHFKISKYFVDILGTNNVLAMGKIDVAKKYLKDNNIKGSNCLLIGDTISDYEIAKSLNMNPVLFTQGHQSKRRLLKTNSILIDNIEELINIITKESKNEKVF